MRLQRSEHKKAHNADFSWSPHYPRDAKPNATINESNGVVTPPDVAKCLFGRFTMVIDDPSKKYSCIFFNFSSRPFEATYLVQILCGCLNALELIVSG
jgi:hypothetical protein